MSNYTVLFELPTKEPGLEPGHGEILACQNGHVAHITHLDVTEVQTNDIYSACIHHDDGHQIVVDWKDVSLAEHSLELAQRMYHEWQNIHAPRGLGADGWEGAFPTP